MKVWMLVVILIIGLLSLLLHPIAGIVILIGLVVIILLGWREKSTEMPDVLTIEKLKRKRQMEEKSLLDLETREQ
ncbi:MAG: hypothetical protein JXA44_07380 [Methanospirillaceae archaeon]|nr:hypothetical protein [Methanospirillaceae archaeon]